MRYVDGSPVVLLYFSAVAESRCGQVGWIRISDDLIGRKDPWAASVAHDQVGAADDV